jgi:microcystin-dependent protein
MSEPFIAEIRVFGFNFAPVGWAFCDGQILPISQNTALFSLIGTYYGGNGTSNFALPNLQGSFPLQQGQALGLSPYDLGQTGGVPSVALTLSQMPSHSHPLGCSTAVAGQTSPASGVPAVPPAQRGQNFFASSPGTSPAMNAAMLALAGGSGPHNNMPPYLSLNFCIALTGIFPPRP